MQPPKSYLFFILFGLLACSPKTGQKVGVTLPKPNLNELKNSSDTNDVKVQTILESNRSGIIATLKTTPCYGKCPVFEIRFVEGQYAFWRGYEHTDRIGYFEAKIEGKVLNEIKRRCTDLGIFDLESFYPQEGEFLEDYPSVVTHVYDGAREQRIVNIYNAPIALNDFEDYLLSIAQNLQWEEIIEVD